MDDLKLFKNEDFGEIRTAIINDKPYFCASDVAKALGYINVPDAIKRHCRAIVKRDTPVSGKFQAINFIPEGDVYRLIIKSKLPNAEKFESWVMDEVLPTIRKTGGYVNNDDVFINTYLPFADEQTKLMFRTTLQTVKAQNDLIKKQQEELDYKEDVIIGLVDDIDLAEKRQILNRVMRHSHSGYCDRWALLYKEFDAKYHINTKSRMESYNSKCASKKDVAKNRLDYIDRVMNKLPDLYDIAAKLFHEDVEKLIDQLYRTRS